MLLGGRGRNQVLFKKLKNQKKERKKSTHCAANALELKGEKISAFASMMRVQLERGRVE